MCVSSLKNRNLGSYRIMRSGTMIRVAVAAVIIVIETNHPKFLTGTNSENTNRRNEKFATQFNRIGCPADIRPFSIAKYAVLPLFRNSRIRLIRWTL